MRFAETCLLCNEPLTPIESGELVGYQTHPEVEFCLVRYADRWGVAVDDPKPYVEPEVIFSEAQIFPTVESVLEDFFAEKGLPRLGGISSGRGWSSYAVYQRCPHAYRRRYVDPPDSVRLYEGEFDALAIGILIHTFMAIYYTKMIDPDYPISVEDCRIFAISKANPELVNESYRVFYNYTLYYQDDTFQPLAIEKDLKNPRTGQSCRFDLIAFLPETTGPLLAGTYVIEHKSASRFDRDTLEGWANDGEVIGQVMHWQDLGFDKFYGPLKGVIVNILGKQKEPKFHRTLVAPETWMTDAHRDDLRRQDGLIQLSRSTGSWPRSRNNCIGRYGRCQFWTECATENR